MKSEDKKFDSAMFVKYRNSFAKHNIILVGLPMMNIIYFEDAKGKEWYEEVVKSSQAETREGFFDDCLNYLGKIK